MSPTPDTHLVRLMQDSRASVKKYFTLLQENMNVTVNDEKFQTFIRLCIVLNSLSLGIEHHDQPAALTRSDWRIKQKIYYFILRFVEISNLVFSFIFSVEMFLKLIAFGIIPYITDGFNLFDGFLVCFGGVEIINGFLYGMDEGSGLSVLRTFRLFRILKLVRFFPGLQRQLVVMLRTMDNVVVFFGLLSLFIFIFRFYFIFLPLNINVFLYSILGMQVVKN